MKTKTGIVAVLFLASLTGACAFKGGNKEYVHPPTVGAELTDLKKAYDRGAIDEETYQLKKQELVEQVVARETRNSGQGTAKED